MLNNTLSIDEEDYATFKIAAKRQLKKNVRTPS